MEFLWRRPMGSFLFLYQLNCLLGPIVLIVGYAATSSFAATAVSYMFAFWLITSPVALYCALRRNRPNIVCCAALAMFTIFALSVGQLPAIEYSDIKQLVKIFTFCGLAFGVFVLWFTSAFSMRSLYASVTAADVATIGCGSSHGADATADNNSKLQSPGMTKRRSLVIAIGATVIVSSPLLWILADNAWYWANHNRTASTLQNR